MSDRERALACCLNCAEAVNPGPLERRFVVCATCGCKRCPKATNHELTCTRSNERGQQGSAYE